MAVNVFAPLPQLPHPEIPLATLLVIEKGLRKAWELLRGASLPNFDLANAKEDDITQQLRLIICNEVLKNGLVDGFTPAVFYVGREAKYANYNGTNTEKMPDLIVAIKGRNVGLPSDDGLFIECKPVGKDHTVGATYCGDGLIRFVEGSYAWAMPQSMMIGYVRTGYTIVPKLRDALTSRAKMKSPKKIETLQYPSACPDTSSKANKWYEAVHITCHRRSFSYVQTNQPAPDITIRHLWLKRD